MTEGTVLRPVIEQGYSHSAYLGIPRRRDVATHSACAASLGTAWNRSLARAGACMLLRQQRR